MQYKKNNERFSGNSELFIKTGFWVGYLSDYRYFCAKSDGRALRAHTCAHSLSPLFCMSGC